VFSKYDINGDRVLDDVELRQMASDLEGQKVNSVTTCILHSAFAALAFCYFCFIYDSTDLRIYFYVK